MSPLSGVVSKELADEFASALEAQTTRIIKASIRDEIIVPDTSVPAVGSLDDGLAQLQYLLDDNVPAFVLVRLDQPKSEWLFIAYVPDSAKIRDKMLYASMRLTLTRTLGSQHFTDSLFATSKSDLTPPAYRTHLAHLNAPKPLSALEREMADVLAAERVAGRGSGPAVDHVGAASTGSGVGLGWGEGVKEALLELPTREENEGWLVLLSIDPKTETLLLASSTQVPINELGSLIPASEPSYAFYAWARASTVREIVFIYSCPSSSPIRHRMLYSSGAVPLLQSVKSTLSPVLSSSSIKTSLTPRKIETSDPTELTESYLLSELGPTQDGSEEQSAGPVRMEAQGEKQAFARPRGPARRK